MTKPKPKRDYKKTLLSMIEGSVGSNIFRSFWVSTPEKGEFDSLEDGNVSCAFYVSSLLTVLGLVEAAHGTVNSVILDLEHCNWKIVASPEPGDVVLWEPKTDQKEVSNKHIGFYMGDDICISNSSRQRTPQKHVLGFDKNREITRFYRCTDWSRMDKHRDLVENPSKSA